MATASRARPVQNGYSITARGIRVDVDVLAGWIGVEADAILQMVADNQAGGIAEPVELVGEKRLLTPATVNGLCGARAIRENDATFVACDRVAWEMLDWAERLSTQVVVKFLDFIEQNPPKRRNSAGFVYLIRCCGRYKIGKATKAEERINDLQLPEPPETICTIATGDRHALETELHRRYASSRKHGEWFDLADEQVAELKAMAAGPSAN
jgi:hypothetical protein